MKVLVNRFYCSEHLTDDIIFPTWNGSFASEVYAIDGNKFLVYDDGTMDAWSYNGFDGFIWVDFTEKMIEIEDVNKPVDQRAYVPCVRLLEE